MVEIIKIFDHLFPSYILILTCWLMKTVKIPSHTVLWNGQEIDRWRVSTVLFFLLVKSQNFYQKCSPLLNKWLKGLSNFEWFGGKISFFSTDWKLSQGFDWEKLENQVSNLTQHKIFDCIKNKLWKDDKFTNVLNLKV